MSQDILSVRPVFALFFPRRTSGCITICWLHRCNNSDIGFCSRFQKVAPIQFCFKIEPKNVRYLFAVASNDGTTQTTSFFLLWWMFKANMFMSTNGIFQWGSMRLLFHCVRYTPEKNGISDNCLRLRTIVWYSKRFEPMNLLWFHFGGSTELVFNKREGVACIFSLHSFTAWTILKDQHVSVEPIVMYTCLSYSADADTARTSPSGRSRRSRSIVVLVVVVVVV